MATGSGKTVVALMILQSCINEGLGPALYVVPDKYLVEQVIFQARELGIKVVDTETDLDYQRKKAILVINIQKLVNGKSVFGLREENNYSIGSVIIDDMHACIGIIQEQFSITIPRSDELYMRFAELFYEAMNIQAEGRFSDIIEERNIFDNMLVPFWNWQDKNSKVYEMLSTNLEKEFIKFKFDLVKDCLKLSHCYISSKGISIIPNCTPIHKIASFDDAKRRIYMSATLPDDSPFSTVIGVDLESNAGIITPEKANDIGERLILVPKIINKEIYDDEVRDSIINKSNEYNVVVLVPSFAMSKYWKDRGAVVLYSSNISEGIQQIKESSNGLYVIVNRYDGIDLPDSACRILVIDGLPNISNMNDKYEQEVVRKSERIQREQIQRIEQGMGRGVRSNSDFCLVFLIGNQLTNMLYTDDGYNFFSKATKEQFLLSEKMCEQIEGQSIDKIMEIGDYLLKRNNQWISICKSSTSSVEYEKNVNISDVSVAMRKSFNYAEIGDYQKSTDVINEVVNKIPNSRVKGYYKQLLAEYMNFIDRSEAQKILKSAKKDNLEILNPMEGIQFSKIDSAIPEQSRMIIDYITRNELDENKLVIFINSLIADLKFEEGTSKRFENAIAEVFQVIGYIARQPESEVGKGPDDFVILGEGDYLVIECKNETTTETINKVNAPNKVEGLIYSDIDNIHAVLLTREKTIPNITTLCDTLKETDTKDHVSKEILLEAMEKFEAENQDSKEYISEWKCHVSEELNTITKKRIKKILNIWTNCASMFNRFFHEYYGIWIDGELRKSEFEATYQIGNLLNIKYEYNDNDFVDGYTFVYYVGAKSKKLTYPNACCMRKVIALGDTLEYEEVLPLMAVEFVRNSQYTVLPFPFKYLREYMAQC